MVTIHLETSTAHCNISIDFEENTIEDEDAGAPVDDFDKEDDAEYSVRNDYNQFNELDSVIEAVCTRSEEGTIL